MDLLKFRPSKLSKTFSLDSILSALKFYWDAKTINSIHSPFIFDLVRRMFDLSKTYYHEGYIERQREQLLRDNTSIHFEDLGAGSFSKKKKTISQLARTSTSNKWKCKLFQNLIVHIQPTCLLEFGTNLGLMTAYLALSAPRSKVHTIEGIAAIGEVATKSFNKLKIKNITLYENTFDEFLINHSNVVQKSDFIYVDGNHSYEGTKAIMDSVLNTGLKKVIVIDDINWSKEMRRYWDSLISRNQYVTIDFYKLGVVLVNFSELTPESFKCLPRFMKPWQLGLFG